MVLVVSRSSLSDEEFGLMHEVFMNPESHQWHSFDVHERLFSLNQRCILCLLGSIKGSGEPKTAQH